MPNWTAVYRISDGLPLAASMEEEKDHRAVRLPAPVPPQCRTRPSRAPSVLSRARARAQLDAYKAQAKKIVKNLSPSSPAKLRIDAGQSYFNYILAEGVCFLCLSDRGYDKRLAFQFLEDLKADFLSKYRDEVSGASRPYAFIKFDTVIQRTKRNYSNTRSQASMQRLNEELYEVQGIMTESLKEVIGRVDRRP